MSQRGRKTKRERKRNRVYSQEHMEKEGEWGRGKEIEKGVKGSRRLGVGE